LRIEEEIYEIAKKHQEMILNFIYQIKSMTKEEQENTAQISWHNGNDIS
jgi:hypothetical protein